MGRRVLAVLAAVVVGLIGVIMVLFYANGADNRAVADQAPKTVYVAQLLVPAGTTAADAVAKGLIAPTQVAAKGFPAGGLSKVDDATAKLVALSDIVPGELVISGRFGTAVLSTKAIQVPDGQFAISLTLADPNRVGTFITPGSRIVIYDTYTPTAGARGAVAGGKETRVLLDDVLVIAIGSTSLKAVASAEGQPAPEAAGALMTVALPPATAPKLVHAVQTGTLYAGLRGTDAKANLTQIVSDASLFTK
jgi:pilus assembly protein CpaB